MRAKSGMHLRQRLDQVRAPRERATVGFVLRGRRRFFGRVAAARLRRTGRSGTACVTGFASAALGRAIVAGYFLRGAAVAGRQ